jgi:hypothetical protein
MSKKQKRQVSQHSVTSAPVATVVESASVPAARTRRTASEEFNPDYTPVISDLKRIAVLALSFTAVLVILSFIIK